MSQFQVCVCVSSCKHYVDLSGCILLHTVICFALPKLPCIWQISRRDIPLLFTFAEMSQFRHHYVQCTKLGSANFSSPSPQPCITCQAHALCDSHCFHVFITSWLSSTSGEIQTCPAAAPRSVEPSTCRGKFSNHFIGWRASCMGCAPKSRPMLDRAIHWLECIFLQVYKLQCLASSAGDQHS